MPPPESFIQHLRDFGYHPRSNKHSNALCAAIVDDVLEACPEMARDARQGRLVYDLNMRLRVQTVDWNVDLVMGTPPRPVDTNGQTIVKSTPATVRLAIEVKGVITEHRKAVKNRKRDFEAHHDHVHNYNARTIAGGVLVVNASLNFVSPLRTAPTVHGTRQAVARVVEHCVNEMRNVTQSRADSPYGIDAKAAIVADFDNVNLDAARYVSQAPAPQPGDPLHYDSFIQKLCDEYRGRFRATA